MSPRPLCYSHSLGRCGGSVPLASRISLAYLRGTLDGELIILGGLEAEHYDLIAATSNGVIFLWDAPLVLI